MRSLSKEEGGEKLRKRGSYLLCASQIERAVAQEKTPDPFCVFACKPMMRIDSDAHFNCALSGPARGARPGAHYHSDAPSKLGG